MAKRKEVDVMKFWPILVTLVLVTGSWFTLKAGATEQDKRLTKVEDKVDEQEKEYSQINVSQAALQSKVDSMYELTKDIKDSLKDIKAGR